MSLDRLTLIPTRPPARNPYQYFHTYPSTLPTVLRTGDGIGSSTHFQSLGQADGLDLFTLRLQPTTNSLLLHTPSSIAHTFATLHLTRRFDASVLPVANRPPVLSSDEPTPHHTTASVLEPARTGRFLGLAQTVSFRLVTTSGNLIVCILEKTFAARRTG